MARNFYEISAPPSEDKKVASTRITLKAFLSLKRLDRGASFIGRATKYTRTVDQEPNAVAKALQGQRKRFLVIVDDIDRLSPDDALTIFRLVKSVCRLPNVIYLLSFEQALVRPGSRRARSRRTLPIGRPKLS